VAEAARWRQSGVHYPQQIPGSRWGLAAGLRWRGTKPPSRWQRRHAGASRVCTTRSRFRGAA